MKKLLLIFALITAGFVSNGQVKGYSVEATDYIILNDDTIRLDSPADGEVIKRISGVWTNGTGAAGSASVDSIPYWNPSTGALGWFIGGSLSDSVLINDRFVEIADSTESYVTPTQLTTALVDVQTVVYSITLPFASTVAGRIALADEGTDYPTGWVLDAGVSPIDIDIEHSLNRRVASVTVFAVTGTQEQQLFNTAAYNGVITDDSDNLRVQSLATIAKEIVIYIVFK